MNLIFFYCTNNTSNLEIILTNSNYGFIESHPYALKLLNNNNLEIIINNYLKYSINDIQLDIIKRINELLKMINMINNDPNMAGIIEMLKMVPKGMINLGTMVNIPGLNNQKAEEVKHLLYIIEKYDDISQLKEILPIVENYFISIRILNNSKEHTEKIILNLIVTLCIELEKNKKSTQEITIIIITFLESLSAN